MKLICKYFKMNVFQFYFAIRQGRIYSPFIMLHQAT